MGPNTAGDPTVVKMITEMIDDAPGFVIKLIRWLPDIVTFMPLFPNEVSATIEKPNCSTRLFLLVCAVRIINSLSLPKSNGYEIQPQTIDFR